MKTESITTHDIRVGDLILNYGMRIRVDQEPQQTNHPVNEWSPTLATAAVIENWDEMVEASKTDISVAGFIVGMVRGDMSPDGLRPRNGLEPYTEPRWVIQGNGLARWPRAIEEA